MPPKAKPASSSTPVEALRHKDKRVNIPTGELSSFLSEDEAAAKTLLYPRDPSLDPQLVWQGKDEQDRQQHLAVESVPIYIQEKIQPRAIIEEVRRQSGRPQQQLLQLFDDFNGIQFEQLIDFYHHEQNWANRMILGDCLVVMASLAEREGLKGKVQMIYVDPPYGIKFGSNWQVSTRKRDVRDGRVEDATREPEQIKAFRDTWELQVHSYLSYLRDRLVLARDLLGEGGSIFVQISDENLHLVRCLLDEVFGSQNFISVISFYKTSSQEAGLLPSICDFIIWYGKSKPQTKFRPLLSMKTPGEKGAKQYTNKISPDMRVIEPLTDEELLRPELVPAGWNICILAPTTSQGHSETRSVPFEFEGHVFNPGPNRHWSWDPNNELRRLGRIGRLRRSGQGLRSVLLLGDNPTTPLDNVWLDTGTGSFSEEQIFVVQTPQKAVARCLLMTTDPGDLVLDPTCGSGTTAYVAEQWGRRWITVDTSRVALALARTRLMAARYPYYLLADSPEGVKKEAELTDHPPPNHRTEDDVRKGFVYRRVPHVTLKSIANNPNIKGGMSRAEIDAAIARHAERETLFDQPYEDSRRIRVSGPFTVESTSPHRAAGPAEERPASEVDAEREPRSEQFELQILENLRKAGVQNTVRSERLVFDTLEPYPGQYLQGAGEYTDDTRTSRRAAVSIGPRYGTVGPDHIREAAKEAMKGAGFDLLVVCAFAFDAMAREAAAEFTPAAGDGKSSFFVAEKRVPYGKLPVLLARMNPDLNMGEALLKKTGSGNLFMVFGEPDIDIQPQPDGKLVAEIKGLDVYDPTTGQIRNSSTDDIACWFIDTEYNGEAFFVRHAYFSGAGDPYERLRRALRVEIDEAAWSALYSTRSYPFDHPSTNKIAVKVINHYGDEVLKVYAV